MSTLSLSLEIEVSHPRMLQCREEIQDKLKSFLLSSFLTIPINVNDGSSFWTLEQQAFQRNDFLSPRLRTVHITAESSSLSTSNTPSTPTLASSLTSFTAAVDPYNKEGVSIGNIALSKVRDFSFYFYHMNDNPVNDNDEMFSCLTLPNREIQSDWDNLILNPSIKATLLKYVETSLLFNQMGVNENLIGINRVVLLHGPPGSGKTSLCRALAQKISIRLSDRYNSGLLMTLSTHSVFSKFFAESAKLLISMFDKLHAFLDNKHKFVCLLIDEVESLTAARKAALMGTEPSDAIRVVNTLLTEIDRLKSRKNVLIVCTSNITEAIDVAFIDRADVKLFLGNPNTGARYTILRSSLEELMKTKIIVPSEHLAKWETAGLNALSPCSSKLVDIATKTEGYSGRRLRKLVFLAFSCAFGGCSARSLAQVLEAIEAYVDQSDDFPLEKDGIAAISL